MQVSLRPGPGKIPGQALGPHRSYVWAWPGLAYIEPEARASGPQAQALTTLLCTQPACERISATPACQNMQVSTE